MMILFDSLGIFVDIFQLHIPASLWKLPVEKSARLSDDIELSAASRPLHLSYLRCFTASRRFSSLLSPVERF